MKGVYIILNLVNNKKYIGSTGNSFNKRLSAHKSALTHNKHKNKHLQFAWNLYGEKNFKFIILEEINDITYIKDREQYWLNLYFDCGVYNKLKKTQLSQEEARLKMKNSQIQRFQSVESKLKISQGNQGKTRTPEMKKKYSESKKGRKLSNECKEKISNSRKGEKHPNFGKKLSAETCFKKSISQKGKKLNQEHKDKLSLAKKGKPWSEARKQAQINRKK